MPGVGTLGRQLIDQSKYKQLLADVAASISASPKHIEKKLKKFFSELTAEQLVQMAQVAATMVAAEVSVAILLAVPEPTMITKIVAVVLQAMLLLFMMQAAISATVELADAGWAWWNAVKSANGDGSKIEIAADAFADLALKMINAILAVGGAVKAANRGVQVPGSSGRVAEHIDSKPDSSRKSKADSSAKPKAAVAGNVLSGTTESPIELLGQQHKLKLNVGADGKGRLYLCTTCAELLPELEKAIANTPSKGPLKSANARLSKLHQKVEDLHQDVLDKRITHVDAQRKLNEIGNNLNILSQKFPSIKKDCPLCAFAPGSAKLDYDLMASQLGYSKTNFRSHGYAVYQKGNKYISRDRDMHNGGIWKQATGNPRNLGAQTTRDGTFNEDLTVRIRD